MQNQRKHKRFKLRLINIESKVNLVGKVEVVDVSLGGALVITEGKLAIGKECSILFGYHGRQYPVKGRVIRSELSGIDERPGNKSVTRYLVGIMFKHESAGMVKDFLESIEQSKKMEMPATANWRYRDIQFNLTTPSEKVLEFPGQFTIQDISRSGVIIQTEQQLNMACMILLELSLNAAAPVSFMGKVVSCRTSRDRGQGCYAVGVEFSDLTESAVATLQQFMESLKNDDA
jgi:c-di-GMP-binding flagellar brake protein YcgR